MPRTTSAISANNTGNLIEIARYYGKLPYIAKLTKDQTRLFVRSQIGVDLYDYSTKELILHLDHFALQADNMGLQISDDGKWTLIDGVWLLDTGTDMVERDLKNVYEWVGFKTAIIPVPLTALSPDGKKLAIGELYQSGRFYIVDLETNQVLYKSIQGSSPVFSPDNSMIATNVQNQVIVWSLSDGRPMQDFPLERFGDGVVFSRDSTLLAIRQASGNIDIWNIKSAEKIKSIPSNSGSCYSIRTGFSSIPVFSHGKELAVFDCNGNVQVWSVTGNLLSEQYYDTDVPSVFFDDEDNLNLLVPPHSTTGPWSGYEAYQLGDFRFLDNATIGFQYYDSARRASRGCTLSLQAGTPSCTDNLFFGTDNKYYNFGIKGNSIQLFPGSTATSQPFYEFQWSGLQAGRINGFDSQHSLLLYTSYLTEYLSETSFMDVETGEVLNKWDKRSVGAAAFSEDNTVAALCLNLTGYGVTFFTNKGKLSLIDLANKAIAYEEAFTCSHVALSHSSENRQLAASYDVLPPGSKYLKSMLLMMNFNKQNERKKIDVGCDRNIGALAYSPDDSLLVAGCTYGNSNGTLHFLNASDGTPLHQVEGYPGVSGLAFSPDGKLLTISFGSGVISTLAIPSQ
jgi:WD40 repeat protein